jgi:hypothetical protein
VRLVTDENMSSRRLALRSRPPDTTPSLQQTSVSDARVLVWAVAQGLPVLTRDHEDFADLHDLILAVGGHHPGILVVRFDNDPRHNLTERTIATALSNLESSGITLADTIHVVNHWR